MSVSLQLHAAELREQFDARFAAPVTQLREAFEDLLTLRCAGRPYAARLHQVSAVHKGKLIRRLPSHKRGLLGIAGLRGVLVPVYDLAALLGDGAEPDGRWLCIAAGTPTFAVAFAELERYARIPSATVSGAIHVGGALRTLIDLNDLRRSVIT